MPLCVSFLSYLRFENTLSNFFCIDESNWSVILSILIFFIAAIFLGNMSFR